MKKRGIFRPLGFRALVPTNEGSIEHQADGCPILGYALLSPEAVRITLQDGRSFEAPLEEALPPNWVRYLRGKLSRVEVIYETSELQWSATARSGPDFILERFEGGNSPQDPRRGAVPPEKGLSREELRQWAAGEARNLAEYWGAQGMRIIGVEFDHLRLHTVCSG